MRRSQKTSIALHDPSDDAIALKGLNGRQVMEIRAKQL
jgi:hypothetical protein